MGGTTTVWYPVVCPEGVAAQTAKTNHAFHSAYLFFSQCCFIASSFYDEFCDWVRKEVLTIQFDFMKGREPMESVGGADVKL